MTRLIDVSASFVHVDAPTALIATVRWRWSFVSSITRTIFRTRESNKHKTIPNNLVHIFHIKNHRPRCSTRQKTLFTSLRLTMFKDCYTKQSHLANDGFMEMLLQALCTESLNADHFDQCNQVGNSKSTIKRSSIDGLDQESAIKYASTMELISR